MKSYYFLLRNFYPRASNYSQDNQDFFYLRNRVRSCSNIPMDGLMQRPGWVGGLSCSFLWDLETITTSEKKYYSINLRLRTDVWRMKVKLKHMSCNYSNCRFLPHMLKRKVLQILMWWIFTFHSNVFTLRADSFMYIMQLIRSVIY